jgi:hypothetical protein
MKMDCFRANEIHSGTGLSAITLETAFIGNPTGPPNGDPTAGCVGKLCKLFSISILLSGRSAICAAG